MDLFTLPDGLLTEDAGIAAEEWAKAFYQAKDALKRIRPVPTEILLECDKALDLGGK